MPGHVVSTKEAIAEYYDSCSKLDKLVSNADVIFLLTDSRESRWLPTVLANYHKKICITAALGYDTFVVIRYGLLLSTHDSKINGERLGCYFCNDIVALLTLFRKDPSINSAQFLGLRYVQWPLHLRLSY
jgi:ubiquitin-like modifier-activating enzyme ATG7